MNEPTVQFMEIKKNSLQEKYFLSNEFNLIQIASWKYWVFVKLWLTNDSASKRYVKKMKIIENRRN
jgi:hypothetical protein